MISFVPFSLASLVIYKPVTLSNLDNWPHSEKRPMKFITSIEIAIEFGEQEKTFAVIKYFSFLGSKVFRWCERELN